MKNSRKVLLAGTAAVGLTFAVPAIAQITVGTSNVECDVGGGPGGFDSPCVGPVDLDGSTLGDNTGAVTVADDLTVTGATTTGGITNTGNIGTGTLSTTGN